MILFVPTWSDLWYCYV